MGEMKKTVVGAVFLSLFTTWSSSLDYNWVSSIDGTNCTSYLTKQQHNRTSGTIDRLTSTIIYTVLCPPWYLLKGNACRRGNDHWGVIRFQNITNQPLLLPFYCMTTSENTTQHRDVLGGCLLTTSVRELAHFFPLPCNVSELNQFMCADTNRDGQLCGRCQEGFAPPVYSYSLKCVNCSEYGYQNWLKYTAIAFGPLTLFSAAIIAFHISATSTYLHGYILFCQLLSIPTILRLFVNSHGYNTDQNTKWFINVYSSIIGIWNLDFFRLMYKPFCLHPQMTIIQSLALDYLIALYPLLLVAITYWLVSLYGRNCTTVVYLWRPLRKILRPISRDLDIKSTLIESFSTLYLLSVVKIQSVSLDLLLPTPLYYADGEQSSHYYVYLAGDTQYFSLIGHLPYALLALVLSVVLVVFPTLLLFLYPCRCCQQILNKANCTSPVLRTYMDVFQGHYKDGTKDSKDFRYFAGVFLVLRVIIIVQFPLFNSYFSTVTITMCVTVFAIVMAVTHPQRDHTRYILDSLFLSFLSIIAFFLVSNVMNPPNPIPFHLIQFSGFLSVVVPLVYFILLVLYWIVRKKRIPQKILGAVGRRAMKFFQSGEQYTPLIGSVE